MSQSSEFEPGLLQHLRKVGAVKISQDWKTIEEVGQDFAVKHEIAGLQWPTQNLTARRFSVNSQVVANPPFAETIARIESIRKSIAEEIILFPELGIKDPIVHYAHEWVRQVFGEIPLWNQYFFGLVMTHVYRSVTPADYQTEGHLNLITALGVCTEVMAGHSLHFWVPYAGKAANQGGSSPYNWSSIYPTTAYNDVTLANEMCEAVWAFVLPAAGHPLEERIQESLRSTRRLFAGEWLIYMWLENHQTGRLRPDGRNGVGADVNGGDHAGRVKESQLPPFDFAAFDLEAMQQVSSFSAYNIFRELFNAASMLAGYGCDELLGACADAAGPLGCLTIALRDPMGRGRNKFLEGVKRGELYTYYLPLLVETVKLLRKSGQGAEADKVVDSLRRRYGTWTTDEGALEVLELFKKYGIADLAKEYASEVTMTNWVADVEKARKEAGLPLAVLHAPLAFLLHQPQQVSSAEEMLGVWKKFVAAAVPGDKKAFHEDSEKFARF